MSKRFIQWIVILMILSCSYATSITENKNAIRGIRFTMHFPKLNTRGKLTGYDTLSALIYNYDKQLTCNFMYYYDSITNDSKLITEQKHFYFCYTKGKATGLVFEKNKSIFERKVPVDSILNIYWPSMQINSIFLESNVVRQTSKEYHQDSGILVKQFHITDKIDTSIRSLLTLKFANKLNDLDFTFSKKLDSLEQMKLFYYKLSVEPRYYEFYRSIVDGFDIFCYFEEIPVDNEAELLYYFDRDRKMNKESK